MRFRTTVVGSFPSSPRPEILAASYRDPGIDPFLQSLEDAVNCQREAGIDIISDGQTRNDMVNLFTSKLGGIRMRTRPVVFGELKFLSPITLDDLKLARELSGDCQLKGIITGPYTLAMSVVDEHYGSTEKLAYAFAEALASEVTTISDSGAVDMIQIDEPFFSVEFSEYARELASIVFGGYAGERALHVCGDVKPIFEKLTEFQVDILDHEFAANPELADFVAEFDFPQALGYGCVRSDVSSLESVDIITERIKKGLNLFGEKELLLDPDCGLRNLDRETASQKLKNMVEAKEAVMNDTR